MLALATSLSLCVASAFAVCAGDPPVDVLKLRGQVLIDLREYDRAATLLEDARDRFPDEPDLDFALGVAHYGADRSAEAEAAFERFAAKRPQEPGVWPFLARLRQQRGALELARDACTRAVELAPTDARSLNLRGLVELKLRLRAEARASFLDAIAADPMLASARFNLGMVLLEDGEVKSGVETLTRAAELDSGDGDVCRVLGDVHAQLEAFADAARWYGLAVERAPGDLESWRGLARARTKAGAEYDALEAWSHACAQPGAGSGDHVEHARLLTAHGDLPGARAALSAAHAKSPSDAGIVRAQAQLAEDVGDAKDALEHLRWLERKGDTGPDVLRRLSEQAEALGDAAAARDYFDRILRAPATTRGAGLAIATRRVTSRLSGIRDVEDGYREAVLRVERSEGRDAADLLLLARAQAARGEHDAAAEACDRAADLFESDSTAAASCQLRAESYRLASD